MARAAQVKWHSSTAWGACVGGSVTGRGTTREPPTSRLPSTVVNRRQRRRELARRRAHATQAGRPRNVLSLGYYSPVKKGHIVPQVFQRSFAIDEQVAVHVDGDSDCRPSHIRDAATRSRFYQRTRRDGTAIDDTEASLAVMESTVRPVLADLLRGDPLTAERKGVLAQFLGLQMVRGPAFFEQHSQHIDALVAGLDASRFRAVALREAEGDVAVARERLRGLYSDKTRQLMTMISTSYKLSSVIGCMRWRLLRFDATLLAYSDHPVVVWPLEVGATDGFSEPNLDPMNAIEVSVALSPRLALLMTWANAPDDDFGVVGGPRTRWPAQRAHDRAGRPPMDAPTRRRAAGRPRTADAAVAPLRARLQRLHGPDVAAPGRCRTLPAPRAQQAVSLQHRLHLHRAVARRVGATGRLAPWREAVTRPWRRRPPRRSSAGVA